MVDQATKRRVTQTHMDAIAKDSGPVYGVRLIDSLPIGNGSMRQAMPSRDDLQQVQAINQRVVAGYEVLLGHWRQQTDEVERLKRLVRDVIRGDWCVTDLQEAIGDV